MDERRMLRAIQYFQLGLKELGDALVQPQGVPTGQEEAGLPAAAQAAGDERAISPSSPRAAVAKTSPPPPSTPNLECPIHHRADPSKYGGFYCKGHNEDGSWCKWKVKDGQPA